MTRRRLSARRPPDSDSTRAAAECLVTDLTGLAAGKFTGGADSEHRINLVDSMGALFDYAKDR